MREWIERLGLRQLGAAFESSVLPTRVEYSMLRHLDRDRVDPRQRWRQAAAV